MTTMSRKVVKSPENKNNISQKKTLLNETFCLNIEIIMLNKMSQKERNRHGISLISGI